MPPLHIRGTVTCDIQHATVVSVWCYTRHFDAWWRCDSLAFVFAAAHLICCGNGCGFTLHTLYPFPLKCLLTFIVPAAAVSDGTCSADSMQLDTRLLADTLLHCTAVAQCQQHLHQHVSSTYSATVLVPSVLQAGVGWVSGSVCPLQKGLLHHHWQRDLAWTHESVRTCMCCGSTPVVPEVLPEVHSAVVSQQPSTLNALSQPLL